MATRSVTGYLLTPASGNFRAVTFEDGPEATVSPVEQMKKLIGCDSPAAMRLENIAADVDLLIYHDPEAMLRPAEAIFRVMNAKTALAGPALILQCDRLAPDHPDARTFGVTPALPIADVRQFITIFKPLVVPHGERESQEVAGFNVKMVRCSPSILS